METVELSTAERDEGALTGYRDEDIIVFDEGLVGFPACKRFVLMENEALAPFRIMRSADRPEVSFLVLDPRLVVKNYNRSVPQEAWLSIGVTELADQFSLVVAIIGGTPEESTANLQAPLLINYKKMAGRQQILTGSRFSVTHPLMAASTTEDPVRAVAAARPN